MERNGKKESTWSYYIRDGGTIRIRRATGKYVDSMWEDFGFERDEGVHLWESEKRICPYTLIQII